MLGEKKNLNLFNSFFVPSEDRFNLKFSRKDQIIASFVYSVVLEVLRDKFKDNCSEVPKNFESEVKRVKIILNDIQKRFNATNKERIKFLDLFMKWTAVRWRNIKNINEIINFYQPLTIKRKDSILIGCYIAMVVGSIVLAILLFLPITAAVTQFVSFGGWITIIGSTIIILYYTLFLPAFLEIKIISLKISLNEDFSYLKSLHRWFVRAFFLEQEIEHLMGSSFKKSLPSKPASQEGQYLSWNTRCFTAALCENDNNLVDSLGSDLAAIVITFCVMAILNDKQNFETLRLVYDSTQMDTVFTKDFRSTFNKIPSISVLLNIFKKESNFSQIIYYEKQLTEHMETLLNDWIFLNFIFNEPILQRNDPSLRKLLDN
ncbi:hypothetical protein TNCT_40281 [Trichonephila clavata]|uniref:Uncharacterized protein n=1 Tax=Trichonephila clavata TaxID=2740835 RepID=A0A8X6LXR9_TRICU|nr:hypothetical protein TNCT_40281 [Trichonephila clavata]